MPEFSEKFKKLYFEKYSSNLTKILLKCERKELEKGWNLANACVNNISSKSSLYPMILGNAMFRVSVTNIGNFPPYKVTKSHIYPLNFSSKKRFKPHNNYTKGNKDKILYIISIDKNGPKIVSEDKYEWKGEYLWEEFVKDVGGTDEIKTFEDFSGLDHPTSKKLIEDLGDIGQFPEYQSHMKK